jgi:cell division septation protein DedD
MKLTCPNCGFENDIEEASAGDARRRACASCGAGLHANAQRAGVYDGYAVGRRVLRVVPAWLLLLVAAFVVALLLLKWASRPVGKSGGVHGDDFNNEATNRTPPERPSPPDSHASPEHADRAREEAAREPRGGGAGGDSQAAADSGGERQGVSETEEAASFSVQAGAFDDRSQANELVSRLRAAGFGARVVEADESKRFRFQVRSGLFRTREEAARLSAQLRSKGVAVENVIVEPAK